MPRLPIDHVLTNATDREAVDWDAPPPYQFHSSGSVLASSAAINATGGIDINFSSSRPQELERLLSPPPLVRTNAWTPLQTPTGRMRCPTLNIVVQVVGSRGDVQPFIALGNALQRYGHRVRLATHDNFDDFVRKSGLEFYPIGGDPEDLMAYMVKNPGLIPSMESLRGGDIGRKRRMMREMLRGCWRSCVQPDPVSRAPFVADVIIANPPSFAHVHCAEALGVPLHIMFTMPWSATRAFPHPLANIRSDNMDPRSSNYLSYGVVDLMTWQGLGDVINHWRVKDLGLDELAAAIGPDILSITETPHTYCWSPALVPKPADWGDKIDICGFFMRDEPAYNPPPDLARFLASGPKPVYIGFGSIVLDNPAQVTNIIHEACRSFRVRVIISRGWSKLGGDDPNTDDVFYLGDCPHEWLFKRVAAVVHHGGAGTTACGLFNACPTTIVPFFGDQPFWGNVVASNGAGPKPIPYAELTTETLAEAIRFCLTPGAREAARAISEKMRLENGVNTAVESLHRHLPVAELTCELLPDFAARWTYRPPKSKNGRRDPVRLSDEALNALLHVGKLKMSDVDPLRPKEYRVDNERWDPLTGGASATLGTVTDFTTALGSTFIGPFKDYKRVKHDASDGSSAAAAGAAAMAMGRGVTDMTAALTKGALVDIPLALADGLKNTQRLMGEEVRDVGKVTDWRSGSAVAAKNFGFGFYDGITGIITRPIVEAKRGGTLGFFKGVGQGSLGMVTKPGSAMFGLFAYPAQGVYKSAKAALHGSAVTKAVERGREQALNQKKGGRPVDEGIVGRLEELLQRKGA